MLTSRGLGTVLGDLASMGFDAKWGVLGADSIGLSHHRARIWMVAHSHSNRLERGVQCNKKGHGQAKDGFNSDVHKNKIRRYLSEPKLLGGTHGMAARMDRAKAIGNGQVPFCAATAWRVLSD